MALILCLVIAGGSDMVVNVDGNDMVGTVVILRCCWVESLVWVETAAVVATGLVWTLVSSRMVVGKKQCWPWPATIHSLHSSAFPSSKPVLNRLILAV